MTIDTTTERPVGDVAPTTSGGALAIRPEQTQLTEEQRKALGHIGLQDCPDADVAAFLHLCQRTGLDPWARQIYLIERREQKNGQWISKWQPQTGIDGFRVMAERHPAYRGVTSPEWCGDDGVWREIWLDRSKKPAAARVGVLRSDRDEPIYGVAVFAEFAQYGSGGQRLTSMWDTKSSHMIAKCAEAAAYRRAFPQDMAGLITADEAPGFERAAARTRVESTRDTGPVEVGELTGQRPAPVAEQPAAPIAPGASTGLPGGTGKATGEHTKRLMAAARRPDAPENARQWAENVLQRDIRSWGVITCDQANTLIERLEAGPPAGGWHVVEVIKPEPAATSAEPAAGAGSAEDDDHAEEYAQLEAERDAAAQGTDTEGGA